MPKEWIHQVTAATLTAHGDAKTRPPDICALLFLRCTEYNAKVFRTYFRAPYLICGPLFPKFAFINKSEVD